MDWKDIKSIVNNYYQSIYRYCYRMLRNKEDAEDLAQEVFINIIDILQRKRHIELHNNYLYKVAYNCCVNKIKRDKLFKFTSFDTEKVDNTSYETDVYFKDEFSKELNQIIISLNIEERSLLILKVIHDMSYDDISKIIGKSPAALRKRYERLRKKIINQLNEKEDSVNEKISLI